MAQALAGCLADVLAGTLADPALGTKVPRRWRRFPMNLFSPIRP
jgi:hypothetical protein